MNRRFTMPTMNETQMVVFAILCAQKVFHGDVWNRWADKWVNNEERIRGGLKAAISTCKVNSSCSGSYSKLSARAASLIARIYSFPGCLPSQSEVKVVISRWSYKAAMYAIESNPEIDLASIATEAMKY